MKDLLRDMLQHMINSFDFLLDMRLSKAVLLAKNNNPSLPKHFRVINLIDSMHKLLAKIFIQRLQKAWPATPVQAGGGSGQQPLDALLAAVYSAEFHSRTGGTPIVVCLDIAQAFDSLSHHTIKKFLDACAPHNLQREKCALLWLVLHQKVQIRWDEETWCQDVSSGLLQGASHSPGLFSKILGWVLQGVFREWQGHHPTQPHTRDPDGWAYIDDLFLVFHDWGQVQTFLQALIPALRACGLRINPDKSQFVAASDCLHEGRHQLASGGFTELVAGASWGTTGKYLKKTISMYAFGCTITDNLLGDVQTTIHAKIEARRSLLNLCHWSRPLHAIQLVTRYIASAWFWVAPLIEPFNYAIQKIVSLQNYTLIFALKLGIPMHLSPASAHWVLRLRRRAIIMFLDKYPQYSWVVCFIKRKWGYLGHHLRKPDTEGTPDVRARWVMQNPRYPMRPPAPWHHLYQWGAKMLQVLPPPGGQSDAEELARDRDAWSRHAEKVVQYYAPTPHVAVECSWPGLRHALGHGIAWLTGVLVQWPRLLALLSNG